MIMMSTDSRGSNRKHRRSYEQVVLNGRACKKQNKHDQKKKPK